MTCEYTNSTLCPTDPAFSTNNTFYGELHTHLSSIVDQVMDYIIKNLHNYIGKIGSGAFEDIYTRNFCNPVSFGISPLGTALSGIIVFYVLLYLLGVLLKNNKYISMAKSEFWEIIILFPLLSILLLVPCLSNPYSNVTFYQGALLYVHSAIASTIISVVPFSISYGTIMATQVQLSQSWLGAGPPSSVPSTTLYKQSLKMLFSNAAIFLTLGYLSSAAFLYMFDFLTYGMIKYILPFALILRFIPPTKRIGGGLIGLSVGLAIFMPLIFWINYEIIKQYGLAYFIMDSGKPVLKLSPFVNDLLVYLTEALALGIVIQGVILAYAMKVLSNRIKGNILPRFLSKILNKLKALNSSGGSNFIAILIRFSYMLAGLGKNLSIQGIIYVPLILISLFIITFSIMMNIILPALTFIVVATGVRAISGIFGEEIDISNLTRLV